MALEMSRHRRLLIGGEWRFFGQPHPRNSVLVEFTLGHHHEMPGRVRYAELMQGFHRDRYHAQSLARLVKFPARNGNHPVRLQVLKVLAEGIRGVETVLAEGKCASGG